MSLRLSIEEVRAAERAIAGRVVRTPSVMSPGLTALLGRPVALKLELLQMTGCFKARGIFNKLLSLSDGERAAGLVTVSGGNHGLALAHIARLMGLEATVVLPETAPERSKQRIRADGARLLLAPDVGAAFEIGEAEQGRGLTYIHSYDDPLTVAGQGTVGAEFVADVPGLTDVLVSIGGGGLISGVATAIKAVQPAVRIWGVETEGADAMAQALAAGRPVRIRPSSIASTLAAPYVTERTLVHAQALVEEVMVVSDAEAVAGVIAIAEEAKLWVEPAAGCLVPAARRVIERAGPDAMLGLVMCGGNATLRDVAGWAKRFGVAGAPA